MAGIVRNVINWCGAGRLVGVHHIMTENAAPQDSALRPAESDLHPADAADDLTANTAEYGRESAAAHPDTSDDVPTPTETPTETPAD